MEFAYFLTFLSFSSSVSVELTQIICFRAFLEMSDNAVPCSTCDNHGGTGRLVEKELLFCGSVAHCSYLAVPGVKFMCDTLFWKQKKNSWL